MKPSLLIPLSAMNGLLALVKSSITREFTPVKSSPFAEFILIALSSSPKSKLLSIVLSKKPSAAAKPLKSPKDASNEPPSDS